MIKQAFEIVLKVKWWDPHIEQLWEYAIGESIPEANEIYLSSDYLNQLRVDLFIDAGADNCPGPIDAGGGPGYDSVIELFYAQNPEKVFKKPWRF